MLCFDFEQSIGFKFVAFINDLKSTSRGLFRVWLFLKRFKATGSNALFLFLCLNFGQIILQLQFFQTDLNYSEVLVFPPTTLYIDIFPFDIVPELLKCLIFGDLLVGFVLVVDRFKKFTDHCRQFLVMGLFQDSCFRIQLNLLNFALIILFVYLPICSFPCQ